MPRANTLTAGIADRRRRQAAQAIQGQGGCRTASGKVLSPPAGSPDVQTSRWGVPQTDRARGVARKQKGLPYDIFHYVANKLIVLHPSAGGRPFLVRSLTEVDAVALDSGMADHGEQAPDEGAEQVAPQGEADELRPEGVAYFQRVIARMKAEGCDAVILGCTEIPLIISDANAPWPTLDSTRLLAQAAVDRAIAGRRVHRPPVTTR